MDVLKVYSNGFNELVSVTPPDCTISSMSTIQDENRGKAPGIQKPDGTWTGYSWKTHNPSTSEIKQWLSFNANIGLRSGRFPGIDIDVLDESLAKEIEDIALLILGPAPRRVGLPPKRLLIYRCNTTFPKMSIRFETDSNKKFLVEVLAEGQQYVIHGIHPSNKKPYTCEPSLDHMHSDELSVIDEKKINQFFCELRTILTEKGFRLINCHAPKEKHLLIEQKSLKGDPEMVSAALEVIPNDTSYDEWIRFGHAVKAALQDNENLAMELWARFSQRWIHGKTEQGFIEDKFRSFNAPFSIGAEWIYQQAREYGFNTAQVDFSPVEEIVSDAEKNLAPIEYSEMALKWRVVKQHRQNFRYMPECGKFLYWDKNVGGSTTGVGYHTRW